MSADFASTADLTDKTITFDATAMRAVLRG